MNSDPALLFISLGATVFPPVGQLLDEAHRLHQAQVAGWQLDNWLWRHGYPAEGHWTEFRPPEELVAGRSAWSLRTRGGEQHPLALWPAAA